MTNPSSTTSPTSSRSQDLRKNGQRVPWAIFLFLLLVPFLPTQHKMNRAIEFRDGTGTSQAELVDHVATGAHPLRRVAFLLLLIFALFHLSRDDGAALTINGLLGYLVLLLVAWTVASLAWSEAFWLTARRLVVFVAMCLGAAAVCKRFSLEHLRLWIFLTCLVYLLLGIWAEIRLGVFQPLASDRRFAGTLHPNAQGVNCGLLAIAGLISAATLRHRRALFLAGAVLGLVFLALTQSRTAFASTIVALVAFWSLYLSAGRRLVMFGSFLVLGSLALLFVDQTAPTIRNVVLLYRGDADTSRVPLWKELLTYLQDRSLLGYGYRAFWTPTRIDEISNSQHWTVGEAHSIYLGMLLELGIVGATLFVLVLVGSLLSAIANYRRTRDPGYALLATLLVLSMLVGVQESGGILATYHTFITMIAVSYLAFVPPDP